jgi:hypothetical protein
MMGSSKLDPDTRYQHHPALSPSASKGFFHRELGQKGSDLDDIEIMVSGA